MAGTLFAVDPVASSYAAPPPAAQAAPSWKTEPEDPNTWPHEPFKKIEDPKALLRADGALVDTSDLVIQGIMKIDKHYYAIINGITVKPGNRIDDWVIVNISRHRVTVRREKEKQTYDIYQGKINRGTK
jgi:hypothetical protein